MPRPRKISREAALDAAMAVFWERGYRATSVDDLQAAMGIQRGSFYLQFKDKRSLFLEVLNRYKVTVVDKRREMILSADTVLDGIHLFFDFVIGQQTKRRAPRGCLNTNTATELGGFDVEVADRLKGSMRGWHDFWEKVLLQARDEHEIDPDVNAKASAALLVALTQGINVIGRVHPDRSFLKSLVTAGLQHLTAYKGRSL